MTKGVYIMDEHSNRNSLRQRLRIVKYIEVLLSTV